MIDSGTQVVVRSSCVAEMREVALPLFREHHAELDAARGLPLDIDWSAFEAAEKRRDLVCRVAWVARKMVGYSVASFVRNLYCRSQLLLVAHALFVTEGARKLGVGRDLMDELHDVADAASAQLVWHAKPDTAAARVLERRCGAARELCFYEV